MPLLKYLSPNLTSHYSAPGHFIPAAMGCLLSLKYSKLALTSGLLNFTSSGLKLSGPSNYLEGKPVLPPPSSLHSNVISVKSSLHVLLKTANFSHPLTFLMHQLYFIFFMIFYTALSSIKHTTCFTYVFYLLSVSSN